MITALLEPPQNGSHSDALYEVIDGIEMEKPPTSMEAMTICSRLAGKTFAFAEPRGLGEIYVECLPRLNEHRTRRPDFAYVSYDAWPRDKPLIPDDAWEIVPEICVEVVSPSNKADDIKIKIEEYFLAGVPQVWVVYPKRSLVEVYTGIFEVKLLGLRDTLTAEAILPGFSLPLKELFRERAAEATRKSAGPTP